MAENLENLRDTLSQLHEHLRGAHDISPETRTLLQGVVADIHSLLGETADNVPAAHARQQESIVARLGNAEREFEATHPTLAGIVGSIIDTLGRMGI